MHRMDAYQYADTCVQVLKHTQPEAKVLKDNGTSLSETPDVRLRSFIPGY
jgi:hypothetical protein